MDSIIVKGNGALHGQIPIAGAKNAALTLMPATLLSEDPITLTNVPRLSDIATTNELLQSLGTEVAHYDIVRKMRASILVLGPMLARSGHASVSLPGGCAIGARPVDLHLRGLEALGELGTYMLAPLIAGGEVELLGGRRDLLEAFCQKLEIAGADITQTDAGLKVSAKNGRIHAVDVTTEPFPGFPTDLQAQMMALLCTADGTSVLEENIFENRFMHAPELMRMGSNIEVHGGTATVTGVDKLRGAPVMATDLRASVSLILAGLAAEGETIVSRVYHLDRGYEQVVRKFSGIGASIERVSDK
ncbi:UNVERIFIED_CONTAM: hypothetical protein GTU68_060252 [Idotea baltica]|nr:hypothetical protein [Idotea baltica]